MQINDDLILYLEELSKLRLSDDEKAKAKEDLSKILNYMDKLNEINTDNFLEISHPFESANNFRDDIITDSFKRDLILKNAHDKKDGYFKVPKTVE